MRAPTVAVRKLQIWAHNVTPAREFLVLAVSGDQVHGFDYLTTSSGTRDKTLTRHDLAEDYVLREDVPEHLAVPRG